MKKLFNILLNFFEELGRVRTAAALARVGKHDLANDLIKN